MGTYYTARAIIGVKINLASLEAQPEMFPNCEHQATIPAGSKYCPACGSAKGSYKKDSWDVRHRITDFIVEGEGDAILNRIDSGWESDKNYNDEVWIFGFGVAAEMGEYGFAELPDRDAILAKIKALLEMPEIADLNLFTPEVERSFGLYVTYFGH